MLPQRATRQGCEKYYQILSNYVIDVSVSDKVAFIW